MTTDINSIRNNLIEFIEKREYNVKKRSIDDIGSNKTKDLFLYYYLKNLKKNGNILKAKQKYALTRLDDIYKKSSNDDIFITQYFSSFMKIYNIAKEYKKNDGTDTTKIIDDLTDNYKKLYLLYNADITDDFDEKKDNYKIFKYIQRKIKQKGGKLDDYKEYVNPVLKQDDVNVDYNDLDKELKELVNPNDEYSESNIKKQRQDISTKNMMYNIILKDLLSKPAASSGEGDGAAGDANTDEAAAGDAVGAVDTTVAAGTDETAAGDAVGANVASEGAENREDKSKQNGGGENPEKDIIEKLEENKEKLDKIKEKIKDIEIAKEPDYSKKKDADNIKDEFDKYDKSIDKIKDDKSELDKYFEEIKTIYSNITDLIKDIDVKSNPLLKKTIKGYRDYSLNDLEIYENIKKADKAIKGYDKEKIKYEKMLKELDEETKHVRSKELEEAKARGKLSANDLQKLEDKKARDKAAKAAQSGGAENKLQDLINIIDKIIKILKSNNNTSNIDGNASNIDPSLFENIWANYNKYITDVKIGEKSEKTIIDAEDDLYDQINMNKLNPGDVLKIDSKDKYIFCALIFFIRLFIVIIVNLLIDNNIIKRIDTALITFVIAYVFIMLIITIVVNLDSYKLRILLNYFNMNMNTNKLILHVFIVVIFYILILIIVFDNMPDKYRNQFNSVYDFSYIYYLIFHSIRGNEEDLKQSTSLVNENISNSEKLKIQYRFEILTMIVYIFSAVIVLIA